MTIVGIVRDVKLHQLTRIKPQLYMPSAQAPFQPYEIVLRTQNDPLNLASAVRNEVWGVDKDIPIANVRTMEQMLSGSITRERFNVLLLSVFAALALALALVGIYGVVSYTVTQGTREIGIRMALGAQSRDILKLVIGQGLVLVLIGISIGVGAALALTCLMSSLLFGVSATDSLDVCGDRVPPGGRGADCLLRTGATSGQGGSDDCVEMRIKGQIMKQVLNRRHFLSKSTATLLAAALVPKDSVVASQTVKSSAGGLSDEFLSRLPQMMELANVPALSAAIIKDGSV